MMSEKNWQRTAATCVIAGAVSFLWCFSELLDKIESWEIAWNPPSTGELLQCVCWGLLAIGAALKLDVPLFAKGLTVDFASLATLLKGKKG